MTEQKIRDSFTKLLGGYGLSDKQIDNLEVEILALYKAALPELAKEAGYKSSGEVVDILAKYLTALKEAGYVRLAEDQSIILPEMSDEERRNQFGAGYSVCIQDMLKQGWRKVIDKEDEKH